MWMPIYNDMPEQDRHQDQARSAEEECSRLRQENARLRKVLAAHGIAADESLPHIRPIETASVPGSGKPSTPQRKIALFRSLFRGREDVYAVRWERNDKSGYSPACVMDWRAIHSARPEERKKIGRKTRSLLPLTDDAIRDHLTGKQTLGIYPLLPDETCQFLAADFDKKSWMVDAAAFAEACRRFGVPVAVERSRSGNGARTPGCFLTALCARWMPGSLDVACSPGPWKSGIRSGWIPTTVFSPVRTQCLRVVSET